jgi:hypothetical protein
MFMLLISNLGNTSKRFPLLLTLYSSVADPHRKNADADPGKNPNADADPDADSCSY